LQSKKPGPADTSSSKSNESRSLNGSVTGVDRLIDAAHGVTEFGKRSKPMIARIRPRLEAALVEAEEMDEFERANIASFLLR
jgi:hypothetical protein